MIRRSAAAVITGAAMVGLGYWIGASDLDSPESSAGIEYVALPSWCLTAAAREIAKPPKGVSIDVLPMTYAANTPPPLVESVAKVYSTGAESSSVIVTAMNLNAQCRLKKWWDVVGATLYERVDEAISDPQGSAETARYLVVLDRQRQSFRVYAIPDVQTE